MRYHWRLSQPIPTYLVAIAVGPYAVVRDTCQACSRPIPASLWVRPQDTAKARASFRNLNQGLQAFEKLFGRYPWSRVGYVNVPMGSGAMEHALNIAYPFSAVDGTLGSEDLWAHELSHAWFGNLVTCQGPSHMFLNEGFARYCEILFFEEVYGPERAEAELRAVHAKALKKSHLYDNGYLALDSIPDANTYGPTVYDKGATAVHTLRGQLGDERFFKGLRDYLASYKFGNATVRQFIRAMEQSTGQELGAFYDGFLATPGWPGFALDWTYAGAKAGQHYIEGAVVQHLQAKPRPVQQLELPVLAVSKNGRQRKRFRLRIGGRRTAFSKELPFEPAHLYLDPEQQVLGATLRQLLTPAELEADSLELAALNCELRPGNKPAAAAPLQVNYRYYPPMPQPKQEDQLALLPMAWHIRGPVPAGTRYELRYNTSQAETWLDQLQESRGWFPADDRPGPAEALQLFYRPQAGEPWQLLPQARHKALGNQMHAWQLTPSKRRTGSFAIGVQRPD
jgi:aminopeptidase N